MLSLKEIADKIGGEVVGDGKIFIERIAEIKEAKEGEITFLANPKYVSFLEKTKASAVIVSKEISLNNMSKGFQLIRVQDPYLAFQRVASIFAYTQRREKAGINPSAIIGKNVKIGKNVLISAFVVIEDDVEIGDDVIIHPFVFIGRKSKIGNGTLIYQNVSIREESEIGKRVILHCGVVVGSDGFGYATEGKIHHKIPQMGNVVIEDDVEIGANTTVDRATLGATVIKKGTKIDNLVQVAHNVVLGENCLLAAQVGISGSTEVGNGVVMGGQAGLVGHISVGDNAKIGAQAGVTKSVTENTIVSGYPARPHSEAKRREAAVLRLPRLFSRIAELEKRIEELEKKIRQ